VLKIGTRSQVVRLPGHDVRCEVRRRCGAANVVDKEDITKQDASDVRILQRFQPARPIATDHVSHRAEAGHPVRLSKEIPSLGEPQLYRPTEETATNETVVGTMRLEDEWLTRSQRAEALATGAPEVHLVQVRTGAQKLVPARVGNTYEGPHSASVGIRARTASEAQPVRLPSTGRTTPPRHDKLTGNPRHEECRGARRTVRKPVDQEAPSPD